MHTNELPFFLEGVLVVLPNVIMRGEAAYFGVINTLETIQEPVRGLDDGEVDAKRLGQVLLDLFALIQSHNAI